MEKPTTETIYRRSAPQGDFWGRLTYALGAVALCGGLIQLSYGWIAHDTIDALQNYSTAASHVLPAKSSPYGDFPVAGDPFQLIPCTETSKLPALNDPNAKATWAALFDPNPDHWRWENKTAEDNSTAKSHDPLSGRGIYLCGYLDVPLDYTNASDSRIARISIIKYQVSGLAFNNSTDGLNAGQKSERTIVVNPGGPGGSGWKYAYRGGEALTKRLSDGQYDVLGFDPRGVNSSLPSISCYPHDADRDRWAMLTEQAFEVVNPRGQLELMDAMNDAVLGSCYETLGDLGRFMTTAFVARDMEEIRKALGEAELTGHFVSYGTGLAQTYTGMFPDRVGRMSMDGTEYVRDHRELGGFGWTALDNGTDAWNDGFLGECVNAGPDHCDLAKPVNGTKVTLPALKNRMQAFLGSLKHRPLPAYTNTSGPALITYSWFIDTAYSAMYRPTIWPRIATLVAELEQGNTTSAAQMQDEDWIYDPSEPCQAPEPPSSAELFNMVVCGDSWEAPQPDGLDWWESLWSNMTTKSWIAGNGRFTSVFPCRQFAKYWPTVAETYRGDLNKTLSHPVMLVAETYDPATPLRNGRRLLSEMGQNARLIVHHGYGHSSADTSSCTDTILKTYFLNGTLPENQETPCYANEKPYLYGKNNITQERVLGEPGAPLRQPTTLVEDWRKHVEEMKMLAPHLRFRGHN